MENSLYQLCLFASDYEAGMPYAGSKGNDTGLRLYKQSFVAKDMLTNHCELLRTGLEIVYGILKRGGH